MTEAQRENKKNCLTRPVFTRISLKVAWYGKSLIDHHIPQRISPIRRNNLPVLPSCPPSRRYSSTGAGLRLGRDWSLTTRREGGGTKREGVVSERGGGGAEKVSDP